MRFGNLLNILCEIHLNEFGVNLNEENKRYLANMALRQDREDYRVQYLDWDYYIVHKLNGKKFTFCEWFFNITKFLNEQIQTDDYWAEGKISGFVRSQRENIMHWYIGTFLIEFSEDILGALNVHYRTQTGIDNLLPITSERLKNVTLRDLIMENISLLYLYPSLMPKEELFPPLEANLANIDNFVDQDINLGFAALRSNIIIFKIILIMCFIHF